MADITYCEASSWAILPFWSGCFKTEHHEHVADLTEKLSPIRSKQLVIRMIKITLLYPSLTLMYMMIYKVMCVQYFKLETTNWGHQHIRTVLRSWAHTARKPETSIQDRTFATKAVSSCWPLEKKFMSKWLPQWHHLSDPEGKSTFYIYIKGIYIFLYYVVCYNYGKPS